MGEIRKGADGGCRRRRPSPGKLETLTISPSKNKRKGGDEEKEEEIDERRRDDQEEEIGEGEGGGGGFFACYLLTSLNPRHKGHTYIGFTVNPKRRIKQHNGELRSGARRTKSKRPWEMALCIYGFPSNVAALQFEWAWQHPIESLAVREAAVTFKSLSGVANKIKLAYTMLALPAWQSLNLTVNFFSTKYINYCAGCPSLPVHMQVQVCSMDELPCYTGYDQNVYPNEELDIEDCNGLSDGKVHINLAEHENRECAEAGGDYSEVMEYVTFHSSATCRKMIEEATPEFTWNIEESGFLKWPRRDSEGYDHTQPLCPKKSPEALVSSSFVPKTFESIYPLCEACSVELDWPSSNNLPTRAATDEEKSLIKSPTVPGDVEVIDVSVPSPSYIVGLRKKSTTVPCDVEVIDLFTPKPSYSISLPTKKRRIDSSEIIDLTKSPLFV